MDTTNPQAPMQSAHQQQPLAIPPKTPLLPKTFLTTLALIIFVVVGLTIYLFAAASKPPPLSTFSPTKIPQFSPTTTPDPAVGWWNTYIEAASLFQIEYPNNWEYSETGAGDPLRLLLYPKHTNIDPMDPNYTPAPIELLVLSVSPSENLECLPEPPEGDCLDMKVDGVPAKRYQRNTYNDIVIFKKGDNLFELMSPKFDPGASFNPKYSRAYREFYGLPEERRKKLFNQILLSFRFLDKIEIPDISNWKTADFKTWSVKYPPSSYACGGSEVWLVCVTANYSNDFAFYHRTYQPNQQASCGKNYQECLQSTRSLFLSPGSSLAYERERTINDVSGIEFLGTRNNVSTPRQKYFIVETDEKDGLITIDQYDFSPKLNAVYEKVLTTIKP